ncbi:DUF1700 domain-containing protein [Clostridium sp. E02]|uniref:DUF1700 domain-containing protein n=1 Tax=Clostridium sp. E02 TaxID=2487134 RepID=UPI000F528BBF|nr:DUF1700 domain-containing protein [Clostridium sp. E02]
MSKQEFLQRLRDTLTGEVPGHIIEENIRFYHDYISTEVNHGTREEDVIASIGDPRLIAKTIMEASENANESYHSSSQTVNEESSDSGRRMHVIDFSKWYWKLLGVLTVILFFFLLASIVTGIFALIMPLMGPLLMVLLIYWFIRGLRR